VLLDPPDVTDTVLQLSRSMAATGARVIAVAHRRVSTVRPHRRARASLSESELSLVGLVQLQDPPCPAYARTIAACHEAGIDVAPVTGDHRTKAANVATPAGIPANRQYVVARATPAGKLVLIQACHEAGHVIAMTGDGVNDGPALRRADIGVTMGERGTEVARQFADLLIGNDDLVTVIAAVEEGRRVYANIRRLLLYALSGGLRDPADAGRPAPGAPLSLLPAQIPWLSLLTHSFAGAAPGTEPIEIETMTRPPREPLEGVLGGGPWWRTAVVAAVLAAANLSVSLAAGSRLGSSALLLSLGAGQLGVVGDGLGGPRPHPDARSWPRV
jgi:Ca2+-transporting ATPase